MWKVFLYSLLFTSFLCAQQIDNANLTICRLKYSGGGDWYNDRSIIPNLLNEFEKRTGTNCQDKQAVAEPSASLLFNYPLLFLTGHGNIIFSDTDIKNLRKHLLNGGFLYIDDDYGMDKNIRREIKRLFPDKKLSLVPFNHEIYHCFYNFANGLPKIHEHDKKKPEGWGIFHQGRLILFYTYETNISDGWAEPKIHNNPPEIREKAFQMGINIFYYALTH